MAFPIFKKDSISNYFTVAFYNLENLFDTYDNKTTYDNDFCQVLKSIGLQSVI